MMKNRDFTESYEKWQYIEDVPHHMC